MPKHGWEGTATVKAVRKPSSLELAWAAGFLEGEGCFSVPSRIFVTQVGKESLLHLQEVFGGYVGDRIGGPKKSGELRQYSVWEVHGSRARGIMMTVYKFMSARRRTRINEVLGHATASAPTKEHANARSQNHSP